MTQLASKVSKMHADASKSHAVSCKRLLEIETQLKAKKVTELFELSEQADQSEIQLSGKFVVQDEVTLRQERHFIEGFGIEPYLATGHEAHHKDLNTLLGSILPVPPDDATPLKKWNINFQSKLGKPFIAYENALWNP